MSGRDFISGVREAEQARQERDLPRDAEFRIRGRLDSGRSLRPWAWGMGLGTAVAAGLALLIALAASKTKEPVLPPVVEDFVMASPESVVPQVRGDGAVAAEHGAFTAFDRQTRIEVSAKQGAVLKRESGGLRVLEGTATLHVLKREAGEAVAKVFVSHGAIEVLGTRFTIVQEGMGGTGTVTLHEGRIRFRQDDGREVMLSPGEKLSWPLPSQETASVQEVQEPEPGMGSVVIPPPQQRKIDRPRAEAPAFDVEAFIEELSVLRRRGQFSEAALRIEGALTKPLPGATSERLSYELGSILTWQLKDSARACAVWADHDGKWPNGRYSAEVKRARTSLGCP